MGHALLVALDELEIVGDDFEGVFPQSGQSQSEDPPPGELSLPTP